MTLVLGMKILRLTFFVSGLVIFFANATTLALDASINSSAAHFVSASTLSILKATYETANTLHAVYTSFVEDWNFVVFEFLLSEYQILPTSYYDFQ